MNSFTLVRKNLLRNKLRTVLTLAAVALPMAMFAGASAVRQTMDDAFARAARELRLGVIQKVSLINLLPQSMRREIEAMDPARTLITAVCAVRWFGGQVPDVQYAFPSLAADADTFPIVYSDYGLEGRSLADWHKYKNAAIVGITTAQRLGWNEDQEVELKSTVPPYLSLRFRLVKVTSTGMNPAVFYFRRDYLDDALEEAEKKQGRSYGSGRVNIHWIKCRDASRMTELGEKVDRRFANTPDETKTQDESTFFASFIKAMGDIPTTVQYISAAVGIAVVMVVANTMSLGFRERTRETAVLRALGFPGSWVSRLVILESLMLVMIGATIGMIPTYLVLRYLPLAISVGPLTRITMSPDALGVGFVIAAVIAVPAGAVPAYQALRLRAADALRKVA
jgi:putative ABC transport system permease protein